MADNAVKKVNFPNGHPYGEIMTEASLNAISRTDVANYFKSTFTPDGSYLVIVGDITKEKARELVEKNFTAWTGPKKYDAMLGGGKFNQGNRVIFVKKPGAVQSLVTITFPMDIKPGHPDQIPLTVANGILGGGGFGTRLMQNLREDKAYTYGCYSSMNITENGSWFEAAGNFRNDVTDSAITQILFELDQITDSYVKEDELNLTKSSMAGGFARSLESPSTIARFALNIIQNNLPKDYYQSYLKRLEMVTKDDVLMMAQTYFTAKNCNIVVVGSDEILEKLKVFDADGKIEMIDAFGNPVKEMKAADITKEALIEKYVLAKTGTTTLKAASKKLKKVKSVKQVIELSTQQIPTPLTMTTYYAAPNKQATKIEMSGMLLQKEYFDGTKGASMNMQTGKKEMTAEEIADKQKSPGLIAELSYATNGTNYELLGMEEQNGTWYYVLKITESDKVIFDYFDPTTFQKLKTVSIVTKDGETLETSMTFGDFKPVNGILFPHATTLMMGEMGLNGKVTSIEINGKLEANAFE